APILSFTAEEVWEYLAGNTGDSVLLHAWHEFPLQPDEDALIRRWTRLRELRSQVQRRLEESRALGKIGSSLAAAVEIKASGEDFLLLDSLGEDLRLVVVTSEARLVRLEDPQKVEVSVTPCAHPKCERCWHYRQDVGINADHPMICGRCVSNLFGSGEVRRHA
ncbi:MAG: zinc finger domain-containing protein, partial [Nitrosospira sp.]